MKIVKINKIVKTRESEMPVQRTRQKIDSENTKKRKRGELRTKKKTLKKNSPFHENFNMKHRRPVVDKNRAKKQTLKIIKKKRGESRTKEENS